MAELKIEIETLKGLASLALAVRHSGTDTKWRELASLLGAIFTTATAEESTASAVHAETRWRDPPADCPRRTKSSLSSPSIGTP